MARELMYQGFDTLIFSTSDFYIQNPDKLYDIKELAKGQKNKLEVFELDVRDRVFVAERQIEINERKTFIMKSSSFRSFAWTFYDENKNFQFSAVYAEELKNFQVRILAKTFIENTYEEIIEMLEEELKIFGIDVQYMRSSRIDWATDIVYDKKKLNIVARNKNFLDDYFYMKYDNRFNVYTQKFQFDDIKLNYVTGFYTSTEALGFRMYDKVLEALQNEEQKEKADIIIHNYLNQDEIEYDGVTYHKSNTDEKFWRELQLKDYLLSKKQVVRYEYQFNAKYLKNKFRYVKDINIEELKQMVLYTFKGHTGIAPKNLAEVSDKKAEPKFDGDTKHYLNSLGDDLGFVNKYKKVKATIDGSIKHNLRMIGSHLANVGQAITQKKGRVIHSNELFKLLRLYEPTFGCQYENKMWNDIKSMFSLKTFKNGILDFIKLDEFRRDYQYSLN